MQQRLLSLVLIIIILITLGGCASIPVQLSQTEEAAQPVLPVYLDVQPNPDLSPEEVVRIQVEALQTNDAQDTGIEITFRFASPNNKQITGPLFRFKELVKTKDYRPMLNHKLAEYKPIKISGDAASQRVTIIESNGQATVYLFTLSKQSGPPCQECWMTDSVIVIPTATNELKQI